MFFEKYIKVNGPYVHKTGGLKGRRYVNLTDINGNKTSMLYSRWLMQLSIGRELTYNETVDHKDNDFTNDDLDNLQIISRKENAAKWHIDTENFITYEVYVCPQCGDSFKKDVRHVKHNRKQGKVGPFCTRSCAGKYGKLVQ